MERKSFTFEFKAEGEDAGTFEGYGSVFNFVDHGKDRVMPGAFAKSLAARKGRPLPMLWRHDQPIGVYSEVTEDEKGLKLKGRMLVDDVQLAREAMALVKAGAVTELSIGYTVKKAKVDDKTGVRDLHEVDLLEVSLVPFAMNSAARVTRVKAATRNEFTTPEQLTKALIEGTPMDPEFVEALVAGVFPRVSFDPHKAREAIAALAALKETLT